MRVFTIIFARDTDIDEYSVLRQPDLFYIELPGSEIRVPVYVSLPSFVFQRRSLYGPSAAPIVYRQRIYPDTFDIYLPTSIIEGLAAMELDTRAKKAAIFSVCGA